MRSKHLKASRYTKGTQRGIVSKDKLNDATLDFHSTMMKDSMTYFERMWQVMNACIGVPTLYGGSEFVQTGYETPNKNVYLGIRNEVLHDLQNDPRYEDYFDKMQKISSLYKKPGLSALRDGTPISLDMIDEIEKIVSDAVKDGVEGYNKGKLEYFANCVVTYINNGNDKNELFKRLNANKNNPNAFKALMKKIGVDTNNANDKNMEYFQKTIPYVERAVNAKLGNGAQIWPLYKKDSKGSQTISIITNLGLPLGKASCEVSPKDINYSISSIPLKKDKNEMPISIPEGYILKRIDDPNPNNAYIIENNAIKPLGKASITLNDTVTTFAIVKDIVKRI